MNIVFEIPTTRTAIELVEALRTEAADKTDRDLVVDRENRMVLLCEDGSSSVYTLLSADGEFSTWQYTGAEVNFMKPESTPFIVRELENEKETLTILSVYGTYGSVIGTNALARYKAKEEAAKAKFVETATGLLAKAASWFDGLETRFVGRK